MTKFGARDVPCPMHAFKHERWPYMLGYKHHVLAAASQHEGDGHESLILPGLLRGGGGGTVPGRCFCDRLPVGLGARAVTPLHCRRWTVHQQQNGLESRQTSLLALTGPELRMSKWTFPEWRK